MCLLFYSESKEGYLQNIGYLGEQIDLYLTSKNIGALWGDETTVYLLADGRYMDRTNAIYIYDGKDTWTDESGVEWNKVVK